MSTRLAVEIDGTYVPLDECDWVLWGPCGCPFGVTVGRLSPTEVDAWKHFCDRKRDIGRAKRNGQHLELVTHQRWCDEIAERMKFPCPHNAKGRTA